jgi:hypothetical protein
MIRRAALVALALAATSMPPPAHAADADGAYAIKGVGRKTCADATADMAKGPGAQQVYAAWLQGYVTGINRSSVGVYDLTPWQTAELVLSLTAHACKATPEDKLSDALDRVLRGMSPLRLEKRAKIVALRKGDSYVNIYEDVLDRAIVRLTALGHSPGPVSPRIDARVTRALTEFQRARGLPESGIPDQATLFNLFVEAPAD